jgi:hypothetical protein
MKPAQRFLSEEKMQWLIEKSHDMHGRALTLLGGVPVYSPMGYTGTWARDMYYTVSGVPEKVDPSTIATVVDMYMTHQHPSGMVAKNLGEGGPSYVCWHVPGGYEGVAEPLTLCSAHPRWNDYDQKPEADSAQFVVMLAHEYWQRTNDTAFVRRHLAGWKRAMDVMPRDGSGLIWIDPQHPHTTYGFTDHVVKTGNELYCSLLYWDASLLLAEMARAVGETVLAEDFEQRAALIEQNIDRLKDPETGVYFAATETGRQIDIWGNAYLVWINFPDAERRDRISTYLAENYDRFMRGGQVRHLNLPEYWQRVFIGTAGDLYGLGAYQNGGYWGTASGWAGYAIAQVNPELAAQLFSEMVDAYRTQGVREYIFEDGRLGPMVDYAASLANPLAALRRLDAETGVKEQVTK